MSTIYLSSTFEDLKDYRESAGRALRRLNHQVVGMEDYVASDDRPLDKCLKDVARCDVYVGLFAHRYGYVPLDGNPGHRSITELEYGEASRLGKPCLLFVLDQKTPWGLDFIDAFTGENERGARIASLRAQLSAVKLLSFFRSTEHLASLVTAAVALHTQQAVPIAAPVPATPEPRQIVFDLYLAYASADAKLADSLVANLRPDPDRCVVRASARGLFARTEHDYVALEADISRCASAAILLSAGTLSRMEEAPKETELVLQTLRERVGSLVGLATAGDCVGRASPWNFTRIIDISAYSVDPAATVRVLKPALKAVGSALVPPAIGLPWVVAAMTHSEAKYLAEHPEIIEQNMGAALRTQFETVRAALDASFVERYRPKRDQWVPPGSNSTIGEISTACIHSLVTSKNPKLRGRAIRLQHYPFDVLVNDRDELRSVYRDIARDGCVLVVDELSLFHPAVYEAVQRSSLATAAQTAIVTVSPFEHYALEPHQIVKQGLKQRLRGAFDRFSLDYDSRCELSIGDDCRLRRWLYHSLPDTLETLRDPRPNRATMEAFAEEEALNRDATGAQSFYAPGGGL